ncbi:hypothetical protein AB4072_05070 [Microvirga sp. 2MCAF38]|uniref:hypothetical protein n=1 Tax=Microvirga sp. 2MCAF38 TaxID=3232989 RepID=UPI003F99D318
MLNRVSQRRCLECGRPFGDPDFVSYSGRVENGPAYWTGEGALCSPACSTAHFKKREGEGRPLTMPADEPFPKGR